MCFRHKQFQRFLPSSSSDEVAWNMGRSLVYNTKKTKLFQKLLFLYNYQLYQTVQIHIYGLVPGRGISVLKNCWLIQALKCETLVYTAGVFAAPQPIPNDKIPVNWLLQNKPPPKLP